MTSAPYTNAWRERTLERCASHGLGLEALAETLGMPDLPADLRGRGRLSLEVVGPVDEYLEALDLRSEDRAVRVSLDPLTNLDPFTRGELAMWERER